jgi:hypothetical protein
MAHAEDPARHSQESALRLGPGPGAHPVAQEHPQAEKLQADQSQPRPGSERREERGQSQEQEQYPSDDPQDLSRQGPTTRSSRGRRRHLRRARRFPVVRCQPLRRVRMVLVLSRIHAARYGKRIDAGPQGGRRGERGTGGSDRIGPDCQGGTRASGAQVPPRINGRPQRRETLREQPAPAGPGQCHRHRSHRSRPGPGWRDRPRQSPSP